MTVTFVESPRAGDRLTAACEFLRARPAAHDVLVIAATSDVGAALIRAALGERRGVLGWHRLTLGALAARLALTNLARRGVTTAPALSLIAVCTRVVARLAEAKALGRFAAIADRPGLPRALATTLLELGQAGVDADELARDENTRDLAHVWRAYQSELSELGLADRALLLREAVTVARSASHAFVGIPIALYDVNVTCEREAALVAALAERATDVFASVPSGDVRSREHLERALGIKAEHRARASATSLQRLQANLFATAAEPAPLDDSLTIVSAPGEGRESIELARRILGAAAAGTPFDRMAVLLRSPEHYRVHLESAFERAAIPAYFSKGTRRPDPSGRALLALLTCASEGLSARRFAEYLSLGVVSLSAEGGAPPGEAPRAERFVPPDDEAFPQRNTDSSAPHADDGAETPETASRSLRAPRRWEKLLIDASVIGGRERWARRLKGLAEALCAELAELAEADEPRAAALETELAQLESLQAFALPLVDALAALPERATWGQWLDALGALATRALRAPESVLQALAELAPLSPVGPITLSEVRVVLDSRLGTLSVTPEGTSAGKVWVGATDEARGLCFDVVFVPGLAERLFPQKVLEDPLLLDAARRAVAPSLLTNEGRIARERVAFRVAVGAATRTLVLSYPRVDADQGRPRVPSFYALEALRAAEGSLPGFDELVRRADKGAAARIGWPAPPDPAQAVDDSEYDLAMLDRFLHRQAGEARGAANYLLHANAHLARALRFRGRRWLAPKWFATDGMVQPSAAAAAALDAHRISARPYSATALERYAACPYKFFLGAIVGLSPRSTIEPIDEMNPAQRGQLIHELQRVLLSELRDKALLPVTAARLDQALEQLEAAVDRLADEWHDRLAPAIERVWEDAITAIRADLREWLSAMVDCEWVPSHFELGFGLPSHPARDPASVREPIELDCGLRLRGAIDLVERRGQTVRATDHKTGRRAAGEGVLIGKGSVLQPVLYALALERLLPFRVSSGRLYYCTAEAGFTEREVPLDAEARQAAALVAHTIDTAIAERFLPAAPADGACEYCDYQVVCGPYEPLRTARKPRRELEPLVQLRSAR